MALASHRDELCPLRQHRFLLVPWINDDRLDEVILPVHSAYAPLLRNVKVNFWIRSEVGHLAPNCMCVDMVRVSNVVLRASVDIEHLHFTMRLAKSEDQAVWIDVLGILLQGGSISGRRTLVAAGMNLGAEAQRAG